MAEKEDISLSDDQTGVLIDLWEAHPCLWNPQNTNYKDRTAKLRARMEIAAAMGNGWTEGRSIHRTCVDLIVLCHWNLWY